MADADIEISANANKPVERNKGKKRKFGEIFSKPFFERAPFFRRAEQAKKGGN